ncbi:MAG: DUF6799 domain-containing protein [Bacteroidota bacterium]
MNHRILITPLLMIIAVIASPAQNPHPGGDYFFLRKGTLYRVIVDTESRVMEEQHITTDITIWPDGRFKPLGGKVHQLKEGEYLDPNGRTFPTYVALRREMSAHDLATERVRLELNNGSLIRFHNSSSEVVHESVTLKNGAVVNPTGMILLTNGQTMQLHEGACVDMAGRMYKTRDEFHRKTQAELKQGLSTGGKKNP